MLLSPTLPSSLALLLLAASTASPGLAQQQQGWLNPSLTGGSSLTVVNNTFPAGLGEPLNIIVSGLSDAAVLSNSADNGGFLTWALSVGFGSECGSVRLNDNASVGHQANLGDGRGLQEELATLRQNFGDVNTGTCLETLNGGGHFRYYQQGGTNAFFLEASIEKNLAAQHDIVPNGYNLGRDQVVGFACSNTTIPTNSLTNSSTFSGSTSHEGWTYNNSVVYVSGMLNDSSEGVNHAGTVGVDGRPAIDGLTAVITVKVTQQGSATASDGTPATPSSTPFSAATTIFANSPLPHALTSFAIGLLLL